MIMLAGPISYAQAIVLGLLQGFSELFPISSLGHSVILPQLLGWNIHQNDPYFITFLVATTWPPRSCCSSSSGATGWPSSRGSGEACATGASAPTTPTPSSAGC